MAFSRQCWPPALSTKSWHKTVYDMALAKATSKILIIHRSFTNYLTFLTYNWGNYYFSWVQLKSSYETGLIFGTSRKIEGAIWWRCLYLNICFLISNSVRLTVCIFSVFPFLSEIQTCLVCIWTWEALLILAANYLLSDPNCAALAFNQLYLN